MPARTGGSGTVTCPPEFKLAICFHVSPDLLTTGLSSRGRVHRCHIRSMRPDLHHRLSIRRSENGSMLRRIVRMPERRVTRVRPKIKHGRRRAGGCVDQSGLFSSARRERYRASGGKTTRKHKPTRKRIDPAFIEPMQCRPITALPAGEKWTFEIKFDGYRCIAVKREREVTLFSRHEKVLSNRFPCDPWRPSPRSRGTSIDGELIALVPFCARHSLTAASSALLRLLFTEYKWLELMFVAKVKNGFVPRIRDEIFPALKALQTAQYPFKHLSEKRASRWGESLTAEKMQQCRGVKPKLVCQDFRARRAGNPCEREHPEVFTRRPPPPSLPSTHPRNPRPRAHR